MPYSIETDNPGCTRGYAVVKDSDREVMGCHATRRDARAQIVALTLAEMDYERALPSNYRPALSSDVPEGRACGNCIHYDESNVKQDGDDLLAYCRLWDAYVNGGYYCNRWAGQEEPAPKPEQRQESYAPNDAMVREARLGLGWRETFGRGGTEVGVARARDIVNRRNLSITSIARMISFFARHEVDKEAQGFRPGEDGYPSAGRIAWALWGGDAGRAWATRIMSDYQSLTERSTSR
jgi:hypothetical protein